MRMAYSHSRRPGARKHQGGFAIRELALLLILAAFAASGCASPKAPPPADLPEDILQSAYQIDGITYYPLPHADEFSETGIASWYGQDFHGKKTSNSEIYNMHAMTSAHKTLPFGTMVEVHNLENDHKIIVRINDRGPFVGSRIIDLSFEAARRIDMIRNGTARVKIRAIGMDDVYFAALDGKTHDGIFYTGDFTIQAGAFADADNAQRLKTVLGQYHSEIEIKSFEKNGMILHRVRAGRFTSLAQARNLERELIANGFADVFVVSRDL
jgi:rare lipoprotein A